MSYPLYSDVTAPYGKRTKMNDPGQLCRTIQAREKLALKLTGAERRLSELPWYRWVQRRGLRRQVASWHGEIANRNSRISAESVRDLASVTGSTLWEEAASHVIPKKNPYGPVAWDHFDEIRDRALELVRDHRVYDHHSQTSFPLNGLPEVKALITGAFIESKARREIEELAVIAASTQLIHKYDSDSEGNRTLRVQHVASGLRARFTLYGDGFGTVASKPYEVGSIDHKKTDIGQDWQRYAGLGIGRLVYEKGQALEPDIRWHSGLPNQYSSPLRKRLHYADPYVWAWSSCNWCDVNLPQRGVSHWMNAFRSTFDDHPSTPA